MERGQRVGVLVGCLLMTAFAIVISSNATATHWCSPMTVYANPVSGYQGDVVNYALTVTNGIGEAIDISSISVKFQWDPTTWSWGTMSLAAYGSRTNTFSQTLSSTSGDFTVSITVRAKATGDLFYGNCNFTGTFRVLTPPPPPTIIVTANPSTGTTPLTVQFTATVTGGFEPNTVTWTFGDGTTGSGTSVSHTYQSAGTFTVTGVVTDARGRSASNSAAVSASEPNILGGPAGSSGGMMLLLIIVLVGVVAVVAVIALRRRRPMTPPGPQLQTQYQPPYSPPYVPPSQPPAQPPTPPPTQPPPTGPRGP